VFQDGSVEAFFAKSPDGPSGRSLVNRMNYSHKDWVFSPTFPRVSTSFCTSLGKSDQTNISPKAGPMKYLTRRRSCFRHILPREIISLLPLFFSTISSLLTLFSKFFSSFLRSTCMLSVSHKYLALEEVYLPFRAAVPNNPTLGFLRYIQSSPNTGLLPSMTPIFMELMRAP
jgi:hypothetical protein